MHDERIPEDLPQLGEQGVVIDEGQLVKQKDVSVPHRDDVAVESSSVDAARMLLGKEGARAVVSASRRRWNMEVRFAGTTCSLPSALSAEGTHVAAFAVHMAAALEQSRNRCPPPAAAAASTSSSLPRKPSWRRVRIRGRS